MSWDEYVGIGDYTGVVVDHKAHAIAFAACHGEQDPVRGRSVLQPRPKVAIARIHPHNLWRRMSWTALTSSRSRGNHILHV
ncbi:MAG: hypothetical protein QHG99_02780 [Methanomicrobiales archaeon]|nr:hypothetical protein [Methanomicrobiales archaeon]